LNDSIINKGPTGITGTPTYVSGIYKQAVRLSNPTNGTLTTMVNYYNVPISLIPATNGQSMMCWVNFASVSTSGSEQYFLVWGGSFFYLNNAGRWQTNINNGSGFPSISYAQVPTVGQWYHAASVYDPTVNFLRLYLNGIQVNVSSSAISPVAITVSTPSVYIGSAGGGDTRSSDVSLSDVRVYNTALTASQVLGIYNSKGIPPSGTLQQVSAPRPSLLWSFENSTSDSITGLAPSSVIGAPTYASGKFGNAVQLINNTQTASGDLATNALNYTISPLPISGGLTITFWVYLPTYPMSYTCDLIVLSGGSFFWTIGFSNGTLLNTINSNGGGIVGNLNYTPGQAVWFFLALTISSAGAATSYINNNSPVSLGTTTTPSEKITVLNLANSAGIYALNCAIDDLRVYNKALTTTQIQGIYQSQGIPPTGSLT